MFTKLKTWKWTRTLLAAALAVSLLSGGMAFAWPPGGNGKGGGGKPPKDDPPPELPPVLYRITIAGTAPSGTYLAISDMNNLGQVVGFYPDENFVNYAFLYEFGSNANQVLDLNEFVTAGVPDGWRLRSALAINDWMVVVGSIETPDLQLRPFAVDLAADNPVVDLLPDVGGDAYALDINENGDILGVYQTTTGNWESWIFNPGPGLYGDPSPRDPRDGTPLDMSDDLPEPLPLLPANALSFHLNNPVGNRDAQIAGQDADGVAFRYTLGAELEWFPELDIHTSRGVVALNDSGTFCGELTKPKGIPYYFDTAIDKLPKLPPSSFDFLNDMNSSGDLIFTNGLLYREDWGDRYVDIDDLVVFGNDDDRQLWFSGEAHLAVINDRLGPGESDSGQIAGWLSFGTFPLSILFFLDPEPAQ